MKKFIAIPLVAVMLTALAVPVLAEENTGKLTTTTEPTQIDVEGKYVDTTGAATDVYSVDIKWGSMKAIYAPGRKKEWDPEKLTFTDIGGTPNPWTWDRTTSSNGLEPNQVAITNKSSASITCDLKFDHDSNFENITGTITSDQAGTDIKSSFIIRSAANITGSQMEKLEAVTSSGYLQLSGTLTSNQSDFQKIGTILVTLKDPAT